MEKVIKIYGPYRYKRTRRMTIFLVYSDGSIKGVSYARYLIETQFEIKLSEGQEIHHRNGDPSDNRLENLQVVSKEEHREIHARKRARPTP